MWEVTSDARVHRTDPETSMRMLDHRRLGRKGINKAVRGFSSLRKHQPSGRMMIGQPPPMDLSRI